MVPQHATTTESGNSHCSLSPRISENLFGHHNLGRVQTESERKEFWRLRRSHLQNRCATPDGHNGDSDYRNSSEIVGVADQQFKPVKEGVDVVRMIDVLTRAAITSDDCNGGQSRKFPDWEFLTTF